MIPTLEPRRRVIALDTALELLPPRRSGDLSFVDLVHLVDPSSTPLADARTHPVDHAYGTFCLVFPTCIFDICQF